jgi:hypothetical protein
MPGAVKEVVRQCGMVIMLSKYDRPEKDTNTPPSAQSPPWRLKAFDRWYLNQIELGKGGTGTGWSNARCVLWCHADLGLAWKRRRWTAVLLQKKSDVMEIICKIGRPLSSISH